MLITITRSPAKVCWHIMFNEVLLGTRDTKQQARELKADLVKGLLC